jgi:hypothetical protein
MLTTQLVDITRAAPDSLDGLARAAWQNLAAGRISEAEADAIVTAVQERRRALKQLAGGPSVPCEGPAEPSPAREAGRPIELGEQISEIARSSIASLDTAARGVWIDLAAGRISKAEAAALSEAIEARRRVLKPPVQAHSPLQVSWVRDGAERPSTASLEASRAPARARAPRQLVLRIPRPVSYDRGRSRERRRRLAYSGPMPAALAAPFTPAEVAVLRIVADEHRERGGCDRSVDEIAARAGVCCRTVQTALRHAERLGLVTITERRRTGAKNLTNVVRVVSREWLAWLERAGRVRGSIGCKGVHPTDTLGFSRDSVGNVDAVNASATRQRHDRRPDRAHRSDAL